MYNKILKKEAKIAVIGLGYVGLPIAVEFARKLPVIGFDISKKRVEMMRNGIDPSQELSSEEMQGVDLKYSYDLQDLREANFYIVAVPTPITDNKEPDLKPLLSACETVGKVIKKGDYAVFESTVYPGCTEEDCVPVIEKLSGLKFNVDFKIGYSPERINPGDKVNTLTNIVKIVSGSDAESLENIAKVYELILKNGTHRASSIKVAEAAKIVENTQRDVNIALMNELSVIFSKQGINTFEVLEAAGTKWNFLKFFPGLVGGHCIGVDPYYLVHKSKQLGYHPHVINSGRFVNDSMGQHVANETVKKIASIDKTINGSKILVMGITFKENVSDIRNTKVVDMINELKSFKVQVDVVDPYAVAEEVEEEYGIHLATSIGNDYDAVVVAVNHTEYASLDEKYFKTLMPGKGILVDIKGIFRNKVKDLIYWSL